MIVYFSFIIFQCKCVTPIYMEVYNHSRHPTINGWGTTVWPLTFIGNGWQMCSIRSDEGIIWPYINKLRPWCWVIWPSFVTVLKVAGRSFYSLSVFLQISEKGSSWRYFEFQTPERSWSRSFIMIVEFGKSIWADSTVGVYRIFKM